jgi:hypothetical protein
MLLELFVDRVDLPIALSFKLGFFCNDVISFCVQIKQKFPMRFFLSLDHFFEVTLQAFNFHVKLFLPRTSFIHLARKLDVSHLQHCLVIILNFSDSVVVSISNLLVILISRRNRVLDVPIKRFDFFLHRRFDFTA